ncbi:MAG: TonB-dependent receptor plug domain-containing protein, partial [Candidatus Hermodarchaeota archaeon]
MKILLDKVPLKTEIGLCPVLKMPVEQIERIEIIRGPGSAIYGEFAMMGVVNIITRKKSNQLFSTIGSF